MLLALICGFALSQAFRTLPAIVAPALQHDFGLTPAQLGLFASTFHFAFAGLQLVAGVSMDLWGPRRTVLMVSPLMVGGALLVAWAPSFGVLLFGQVVLGIGCAPAFNACNVLIAQRFPPERFAAMSGITLGIGSIGLLVTGTPLAWVIEASSWRVAFVLLAAASALAWAGIWTVVRELPVSDAAARPGFGQALRGYGELLRLPQTWGIVALSAVTYSSFMALRGLWLGPMLAERHGFNLVAVGNVALVLSLMAVVGPPVFGRMDPGQRTRRYWLTGFTLVLAGMFALMAVTRHAWIDVGMSIAVSLLLGYSVLQYADVRNAYPERLIGRALALYTMAMFMGVALVQWFTGIVAGAAPALGLEAYAAVLGAVAALLVAGAAVFWWTPWPPQAPE